MNISYYNKGLNAYSRDLRKHGTSGEVKLWTEVLRNKNFYGLQFNRQFPINKYIVDFICRRVKLIIEVDGASHQHKVDEDQNRDHEFAKLGYSVIRITEGEVLNDLPNVIRALDANLPEEILMGQSPQPPSPRGRDLDENKNRNYIQTSIKSRITRN
jgi:very-short-patch-repair endonuclease